MIAKKYFKQISEHHKKISMARRALQGIASEILGASKRAIFAMQRKDAAQARRELKHAENYVKQGKALIKKEMRLGNEGMWKAALEEHLEAVFYVHAMTESPLPSLSSENLDPDIFVGALSDYTGELTRSCVLAATERDTKEVKRLHKLVAQAVEFLLQMDLTGQLRQKFDQAKQNLRKIEEIAFNVSMHVKD